MSGVQGKLIRLNDETARFVLVLSKHQGWSFKECVKRSIELQHKHLMKTDEDYKKDYEKNRQTALEL